MTTIINTKQLLRITIRKNVLFVLLIFCTACTKKEALTSAAFKTNSGWGYTISYKKKIVIKQSIIPVISAFKSFETETEALQVANLVKQKLENNLSPTVTKNELILLKIKL
ncbi:DUF4907 domain-containing protein [Flavobacterium olei]|uniref:DUF4907 domain-containing protein n=1 Tax=Flavobacterium olei TaxID=1886782 RepID=UPI00321AAD07